MSRAPSPWKAGLGRGARRAALHLLKAGIETLKAVEALVEEVRRADRPASESRPQRIPVD